VTTFSAELFRIDEPGGWYFISIPDEHAPDDAGAWGRSAVTAVVDGHEWATSAWRDTRRGWLLPVPKRIRGDREAGDVVQVRITPDHARINQ
jgi:hypothetical protein